MRVQVIFSISLLLSEFFASAMWSVGVLYGNCWGKVLCVQ